jgi:perosamine synthetase
LRLVKAMFVPATPRLTFERQGDWQRFWPGGAMLFARARFALFEGLVALARRHGVKRVWLPAYLCCPVPEAVEAAGLAPVLYDVDEHLAPSLPTITPVRGDALLVVHYFGLIAPLSRIRAFCDEHGMPLIEDCAHALPDPDRAGAGSAGVVSVWSLRKLGPLPGGALLAVRDPSMRRLVVVPPTRVVPDSRTLARLAIMLVERLADLVGWNPMRFKNRLPVLDASRVAAAVATGRRREYARPVRPARLIQTLLERACWRGVLERRRAAYQRLAEGLASVPGLTRAVPTPSLASVPEAFPVFVEDPRAVAIRLRRRGVEAARWPGAEQFPFDAAQFPGATRWVEHSLCLPVGTALTPAGVDRLIEVVRDVMAETQPRDLVRVA